MIKLSVGVGAAVVFLLAQLPPEPTPVGEAPVGPFSNSGQIIMSALIVVTGWFTSFMADRREARKDAAAAKQRKEDRVAAAEQRKWDDEDRARARDEARREDAERAEAVRREVAETRRALEDTANAAKGQDKKLDNIATLVDGKMSSALQKIADLEKVIADKSNRPADIASARTAQEAATEQHARVREVEGTPPAKGKG